VAIVGTPKWSKPVVEVRAPLDLRQDRMVARDWKTKRVVGSELGVATLSPRSVMRALSLTPPRRKRRSPRLPSREVQSQSRPTPFREVLT
jgi:hypothetical protein